MRRYVTCCWCAIRREQLWCAFRWAQSKTKTTAATSVTLTLFLNLTLTLGVEGRRTAGDGLRRPSPPAASSFGVLRSSARFSNTIDRMSAASFAAGKQVVDHLAAIRQILDAGPVGGLGPSIVPIVRSIRELNITDIQHAMNGEHWLSFKEDATAVLPGPDSPGAHVEYEAVSEASILGTRWQYEPRLRSQRLSADAGFAHSNARARRKYESSRDETVQELPASKRRVLVDRTVWDNNSLQEGDDLLHSAAQNKAKPTDTCDALQKQLVDPTAWDNNGLQQGETCVSAAQHKAKPSDTGDALQRQVAEHKVQQVFDLLRAMSIDVSCLRLSFVKSVLRKAKGDLDSALARILDDLTTAQDRKMRCRQPTRGADCQAPIDAPFEPRRVMQHVVLPIKLPAALPPEPTITMPPVKPAITPPVESPITPHIESSNKPHVESPDEPLVETPNQPSVQSPDEPTAESPNRPSVQSPDEPPAALPNQPSVETPAEVPKQPHVESPDEPPADSPNKSSVESPDELLTESPDEPPVESANRAPFESPIDPTLASAILPDFKPTVSFPVIRAATCGR